MTTEKNENFCEEEIFKVFERDVDVVSRVFQYYLSINKLPAEDERVYDTLNHHAQFWLDYHRMCVHTIFITLGRVFDKSKRTHKIDNLLKQLRKHGTLSNRDLKKIKSEMEGVKKHWKDLVYIRNKVFAHSDTMFDAYREGMSNGDEIKKIKYIVNRLQTIKIALKRFYIDGRKLRFDFGLEDEEYVRMISHDEISELLALLVKGKY